MSLVVTTESASLKVSTVICVTALWVTSVSTVRPPCVPACRVSMTVSVSSRTLVADTCANVSKVGRVLAVRQVGRRFQIILVRFYQKTFHVELTIAVLRQHIDYKTRLEILFLSLIVLFWNGFRLLIGKSTQCHTHMLARMHTHTHMNERTHTHTHTHTYVHMHTERLEYTHTNTSIHQRIILYSVALYFTPDTQVISPSFSGSSYIHFARVDGTASMTSLEVSLWAQQGSGLILYASQYTMHRPQSDFIALALENYTVVLHLNLGRLSYVLFRSCILQTGDSRDIAGLVYVIVRSPRQVTHLPPVWDLLLPLA